MSPATIEPSWLSSYATGEKLGWAQAVMAYADYYCVDGSADEDPEIEERLIMHRPPMVGYASRTGTRRNLEALAGAEWRLLVSAKGAHRPEGMRYALDNGAWTAYQQGEPFDELAFMSVVEKLGEGADWIVLPDIVQGGLASLEYSLRWKERRQCRQALWIATGLPGARIPAFDDLCRSCQSEHQRDADGSAQTWTEAEDA
ncbi:hypothetical protein [Paraburkholderia sp. BL10I2N1]|uniref:hypothetical protein n=1 Tax=Paraburkholderia sp. BL10I2N1 TaxID=1938796 RepID=UPI0010E4E0DA|nr:hypothetical protein [Paraburkholderia sp. BL10I2N1]TDN58998.1 hypothetical protein B0G77_8182 [Paraburkholderia sp. BL10I2N1]